MYKHVYSITRKLGVRRCEDGQLVGDPRRGSTCRVCQDRPQVSCGEFCQRWVNGWHPEGQEQYESHYIYIYGEDYILYTCLVWRNSQENFTHSDRTGSTLFFFIQFFGGNITCVGQEQLREVSHSGPGCVNRGGSQIPSSDFLGRHV